MRVNKNNEAVMNKLHFIFVGFFGRARMCWNAAKLYEDFSITKYYPGLGYIFKTGKHYGVYGDNGRQLVAPIYDSIYLWTGRLRVTRNDLNGILDIHGKEILPCKFHEITFESGEYVAVRDGLLWGLFSFNNGFIFPPNRPYLGMQPIDHNCWLIKEAGEWRETDDSCDLRNDYLGIINDKGETIVPAEFDEIATLDNGNFAGYICSEQSSSIFSPDGKLLQSNRGGHDYDR